MNWTAWTLALHITAAILWIGGLFVLARLLVEARVADASETFAKIAERLFESIVHPALMVVLATGILLVFLSPAVLLAPWFYAKVGLVMALVVVDHRIFRSAMATPTSEKTTPRRLDAQTVAIVALPLSIAILSLVRPF